MAQSHDDNVVVGAGRLYVAALDAEDSPLAERYLGDSVAASLAGGEGDRLQVFKGDGADASAKLIDKLQDVTRSMSVTLHDIHLENIALFVMGETKSARAAAAVADEEYPACSPGDEFQVGVYKAANAGGFPSIVKPTNSASITGKAGSSDSAVAATKIRWQAKQADDTSERVDGAGGSNPSQPLLIVYGDTGRVEVAAAVAAGDSTVFTALQTGFKLSYTPGTQSQYVEGATDPVEGAVRYVEFDPRAGAGRNIYMTKATIRPNGEWPLKTRGQEQTLTLTCESLGKVYVDEGVSA